MFPLALVCGNTFLLKPSERVPNSSMLLAQLAQDAGVPDGVLNIIHGARDGENIEHSVFTHNGWFNKNKLDKKTTYMLNESVTLNCVYICSCCFFMN